MNLTCFKTYDIRSQLGEELNEKLAHPTIGRTYAQYLNAKKRWGGWDERESSEALIIALLQCIIDTCCDVIGLGRADSKEFCFEALKRDVGCVNETTTSHNPIDFGCMKLVKCTAELVRGDIGLKDIQELAESQASANTAQQGKLVNLNLRVAYPDHLLVGCV